MTCQICKTENTTETFGTIDCPRCGKWRVVAPELPHSGPDKLTDVFGENAEDGLHRRARLSHLIRLQQSSGPAIVKVGELDKWGLDDPLPSPGELAERIILWLGNHQRSFVDSPSLDAMALLAWMGAPIFENDPLYPLSWMFSNGRLSKYLFIGSNNGVETKTLTMEGWERFEILKSRISVSRTAFMAMSFNDEDVRQAFESCFKPAVKKAGFDLRLITEGQGAGLIDDQMRVAIRNARFVISDLSHDNRGAYWEGGFAEGLGRPVIYTCREDVLNDKKIHFDTNHLVTVPWKLDNLPEAAADLTATVRATLPGEAIMSDD